MPVRLVLGLTVLMLGVVFLADSAGLLNADSAIALWPLAVVVVGLVVVLQPDIANRLVGAVLLAAGLWLLLNNVGVWSYAFWRTWPALLMLVGAWMVYRVRGMREREADGFAFLDHVDRQATSARFHSSDVSAVLGSCCLDLRRVALANAADTPIVDTFALLGTIQLLVPAGWTVESRVVPLLGRVDTPAPPAGPGPTLVVQGSVIGGRLSVTAGP